MKSELKERLERLARTPGIGPVPFGSPVDVILRLLPSTRFMPIDAIKSLARRNSDLLRSKRAVEAMLDLGEASIHLPMVEDMVALAAELAEAGISATCIAVEVVDVKELRGRLGLTQEQFARHYGLDIDAVQNWEQGRCRPDKATQSYLHVISRLPKETSRALERPLAASGV
jgi:DNA-binding transcriptional regulator YiaG